MSGAYTTREKVTDVYDIVVRILGQLIGWAVVCFAVVGPNKDFFVFGLPGFKHRPTGSSDDVGMNEWFFVFNEFVATFIEGVAISFMIMPLLKSYPHSTKGVDGSQSNEEAKPPKHKDGFQSKEEAKPPKNKDLWFAAISLSILHYVLERLFRTTMNPFVYIMYRFLTNFDNTGHIVAVVLIQLLALFLSCIYCYFLLPSHRVFDHVRLV
jgi:hypothetical protein